VDLIDGYGTDGQIARYGLVVLVDDREFFPPYDAAPLVSRRLAEESPGAVTVLTELSGRFDESLMRELNRRVEVDGAAIATVAADALVAIGLVADDGSGRGSAPSGLGTIGAGTAGAESGRAPDRALLPYLWGQRADTLRYTRRHLVLVAVSLAAGLLVAVPLGLVLERVRVAAEAVIRGVGVMQTVPSIALLAFMIPLFGIGVVPAVVALFLYSLLPMLRNTYTGVRDADASAVASARALGMTELELLWWVRLPLAAPVIMAGVRTAAVINVGTATLAAFIGAGGLGDPIVAGLALSDTHMILSGAIPAAVLALLVDSVLAVAERLVTPKGVG
jgi:osmoprotectant transport system permease protein